MKRSCTIRLNFFFEQRGYEIKGEVRHCDLVGIIADEEEPLIVEMKKTFNLSLLLQGMERLKISNHVYLAVERSRAKRGAVNQRWGEIATLCSKLGLGLMTVTFYKSKKPFVEVICEPGSPLQAQRKLKSRKTRLLNEFRERSGDYNVGGSTRAKLMTAYREKALRVALASLAPQLLELPQQLFATLAALVAPPPSYKRTITAGSNASPVDVITLHAKGLPP